jgi:two-component system phosphate regulon sensor histidine kinase PhoR
MQDLSEIRRLERIRNEFVSNVTHELKTPITAIRGFTETLLKGALQYENTSTSFLQIIAEESERLHRLIGDVLYLSKVESKQIELHYCPLELHAFFERIFLMMKNQAHNKKIQMAMKIPLETYIEADEDRLRQIVLNLLSNAIAYSNEGGWVSVTVESGESGETDDPQQEGLVTRLIVEDGGMGIPKHDLPRIFERFYRVDKARTRQSGGTGLGLSIAKHLIELHHGTISVESTVGVGTRFTIEIPTVQW